MAQKQAQSLNFGEFLNNLANSADAATSETLAELQKKMQLEKQAQIEDKLRQVFNHMQEKVNTLRLVRKQEKAVLAELKDLQERANKIAAGEETDEEVVAHVRRVHQRW